MLSAKIWNSLSVVLCLSYPFGTNEIFNKTPRLPCPPPEDEVCYIRSLNDHNPFEMISLSKNSFNFSSYVQVAFRRTPFCWVPWTFTNYCKMTGWYGTVLMASSRNSGLKITGINLLSSCRFCGRRFHLLCNVWVIVCVCVCVCVCVGGGWQSCGCFGNMCTCIYCVLYSLYCVFCIVSFMYIYPYLFCLYYCKDYCHRVTTQLQ